MRQRNFTLLIIIIVIILALVFGWFYFFPPKNTGDQKEGGFINFISEFMPFGQKIEEPINDENNTDISGLVDDSIVNKEELKLIKISNFPVSGYGIFQKERYEYIPEEEATSTENPTPPNTTSYPQIRYVEKSTGNIYQTFADQIEERQFSSAIIPTVYEAFLGNNGESAILRYLKNNTNNIETFLGKLPKEQLGGDSGEVVGFTGSFLPENISSISISPDASSAFYLLNTGATAIGTIINFENNSKTQIFDSSLTGWISEWVENNKITVTTKPSYNSPGYMYVINVLSKGLNKVLGGITGLTTLMSPDSKRVVYSDNTLSLYLYDIESGKTNSVGIKTLPEKCVWSNINTILYCAVPKNLAGSQYPDSWYQGLESFSDDIWMINWQTGNTILLANPSLLGSQEIDLIKPKLDQNEDYLFFVNKKDSLLWELKLK